MFTVQVASRNIFAQNPAERRERKNQWNNCVLRSELIKTNLLQLERSLEGPTDLDHGDDLSRWLLDTAIENLP